MTSVDLGSGISRKGTVAPPSGKEPSSTFKRGIKYSDVIFPISQARLSLHPRLRKKSTNLPPLASSFSKPDEYDGITGIQVVFPDNPEDESNGTPRSRPSSSRSSSSSWDGSDQSILHPCIVVSDCLGNVGIFDFVELITTEAWISGTDELAYKGLHLPADFLNLDEDTVLPTSTKVETPSWTAANYYKTLKVACLEPKKDRHCEANSPSYSPYLRYERELKRERNYNKVLLLKHGLQEKNIDKMKMSRRGTAINLLLMEHSPEQKKRSLKRSPSQDGGPQILKKEGHRVGPTRGPVSKKTQHPAYALKVSFCQRIWKAFNQVTMVIVPIECNQNCGTG
jgi:hypothetical protein